MGFLNKLFGIPPVGSEHGEMVDLMLELVHWIMAILFVGWSIYLTVALIRFYRKRNPKADHAGVRGHASSHLEIGVIITEVILLLGFAFPLWATQVDRFPDPDVRVEAWAQQFGWNFHYPGPDGKFGTTNRFLITSENPIGIDPDDPNSLDDFVTSSLALPKGKKVEIAVTSKDVIHNFALVGMRTATDADPGKVNRVWFIPIVAGKSDVVCGQLCGAGHGGMRGELNVMATQAEFDEWQKQQSPVRDKGFAADAVKKLGVSAPAPAVPAAAPVPAAPAATPVPATPAPAPAVPATPAPAALAPVATPATPVTPAPAPVVPATPAPAAPAAAPAPAPVPTPTPVPAPTIPATPPPAAAPAATAPVVVVAEAPAASDEVAKLQLGVIPNVMQFDKKELTVKAGQKVVLLFANKGCALQHNFLLLKPGTKDAVGVLADKMLADPQGLAKLYFPESPDILVKGNKLVGIGQSDLIEFTAPAAGDYPYICTFPGHWRLMNGVLKVTP